MDNPRTLICGSLAYDTIMVFQDQFKNHILPDKVHILNVSFLVPRMRKEFGGCAGNISYNQNARCVFNGGLDYGYVNRYSRRQVPALKLVRPTQQTTILD